ncbi:PREDICTED: uncharacterized protein LOC106125651, partial [Papilio xuthus]|uniref:Uncharacterized protein LOC106125651 n=1 Tax=Papilio xuthus TaxID=66420 RepID=A0AAJ6ZSH0_PAPXU
IFMILIIFSNCKIQISIKCASNKNDIKVTYNGDDKKIITNTEVNLFNITNYNLNKGVRIELGKEPDDIFINDPTKYGNLYEKYNWTPVKRKLQVKNIKIIEIITDNIIIKNQECINNTTRNIKKNISIYEIIEDTVRSFWYKNGLPEESILYNMSYNFHGQIKSFENQWRKNNFHSVSLPFGIKKDGYINIKPGGKATIRLKGKKMIILIEVLYLANLIGNVVVNYAHLYGKYHFWAPTVNDIMKANNITNRILTTELLEIRCYSDPIIEIFDMTYKS